MISHHHDFRSAMMACGLTPPEYIEPGKICRFPGVGKGRSNRAGWCILFADGRVGRFGDFASGMHQTWKDGGNCPLSRAERAALMARAEVARKRAEAVYQQRQMQAASKALAIWRGTVPADPAHPYLGRKRIRPHSARQSGDTLILPVTDFLGSLTTLQFIGSAGAKRLLTGGRKSGCFIHVSGPLDTPQRVIICEGWATGCTLAEDDPTATVLAAIDCGNLEGVAVSARDRWAYAELIIAGDDDRRNPINPGVKKAYAAARAAGAQVALPQWPPGAPLEMSDFNDLSIWLTTGGWA